MRRFLLCFLLFASTLAAAPPDPRVVRIEKELDHVDLFGLMQGGVTRATMLDYQGIATANAGCPPQGIARSFYDPLTDTFKVIDYLCNVIISGGGGGGGTTNVAWNQLLNPNGNSAPQWGGAQFNFSGPGYWNFGSLNFNFTQAANLVTTTPGQIGLDTTLNNVHYFTNVDNILLGFPSTTVFNNGDTVSVQNIGGNVTFVDQPTNGSGGAGNTSITYNVTNPQVNQTFCIDAVTGNTFTASNCTPGVPIDLETANYSIDMVNDRGSAVVMNSPAAATTITVPQAFSNGTDGDANWFNFDLSKGPFSTCLVLTSPSTWDSTGTATDCLLPGQQVSLLSDPGTGIAYPKAHEPRLIEGNGVTLDRSNPYFLKIAATPASTFTGNQIISGCGVSWTSGLTFEVGACTYQIAATTYTTAETSITLSAADGSNPRFDDIVVNTSSAVDKITGTAAANPLIPTADPTTQLLLSSILVPAASSTAAVTTVIIYQNNAGGPTEWNCTSSANINCNSTNNPYGSFTHSVEATTAVAGNQATFTIGSGTVNLAQYNAISFYIRNKAAWAAAKSLQLFFRNGTANIGTAINFKQAVYGFNQTNTTTYQLITIPLTAFQTGVAPVTNLRMQVAGSGAGIGFYLGNITLQGGFAGGGGNGGGGGNFQLQVNSTACQTPCNLQDSASVTWAQSVSSGVTNISATASATITDFPDVHIIPAANCGNATAGNGWSYAASVWTAACRAGSNNLGGALQLAPNSGGAAQFRVEMPGDWDTTKQPYIRIEYGSGANTSGTVIWTVASACTSTGGTVTDDGAFNSESAFASQTMANTNRGWSQTGQFTAITSGNNCVAGSGIIIRLTLSGTASSAINAYQAVLTIPRNPVFQAN